MAVGWDGRPVPQNAVVEVLAVANCANTAPDHIAHHRDTAIGGSEMCKSVPRDTAVNAHLRVVIAGYTLAFCIRAAPVLSTTRPSPRLPALSPVAVTYLPGILVVVRHRPGHATVAIDR